MLNSNKNSLFHYLPAHLIWPSKEEDNSTALQEIGSLAILEENDNCPKFHN